MNRIDPAFIEIIAPNFKRRLSGVTSTIVQLVPAMHAKGMRIAALGPGLPGPMPRIDWSKAWRLWKRPSVRPFRIWHARRNVEMVGGLVLRDILRLPLRLVFTCEAQRHHRAFTKWLMRRMNAIVTTNARSASYIEVPYHLVPHGVDISDFHPPRGDSDAWAATGLPGRYGVGCFGRVREQKGTDLFVDAMIALLPSHPDWTAVISGRVTVEHRQFADALKRRVEAAGLADRIVFLGEVDDIKPWYRRIALYVAPSRNEGFGLTPIEAMASGKPAVASDAGAYRDMIRPGIDGAVVAAGDGDALREAIRPYLDDPALAEQHGAAAIESVRMRFSLDAEVNGLAGVYDMLWGGR